MSKSTTNGAALYARVSTTGHGQDVGLQVDELRAVAAQRGLALVAEYVDDGVSGAATSRPAFDRMMEDARRGKFDHLLVWKLDRVGRSLPHLVGSLDLLVSWGVSFTSVRDPGIETGTSQGRLLLQLLGVFASYERDLIRGRVTAGVRRRWPPGGTSVGPASRCPWTPPWPSSATGGAFGRWRGCSA